MYDFHIELYLLIAYDLCVNAAFGLCNSVKEFCFCVTGISIHIMGEL